MQPKHGINPSARQLQNTIKRIKKAGVNILFAEQNYQQKYIDIIYQETGCRIYRLSHLSSGEYTTGYFEEAMRENMNTIVMALSQNTEVGEALSETLFETMSEILSEPEAAQQIDMNPK